MDVMLKIGGAASSGAGLTEETEKADIRKHGVGSGVRREIFDPSPPPKRNSPPRYQRSPARSTMACAGAVPVESPAGSLRVASRLRVKEPNEPNETDGPNVPLVARASRQPSRYSRPPPSASQKPMFGVPVKRSPSTPTPYPGQAAQGRGMANGSGGYCHPDFLPPVSRASLVDRLAVGVHGNGYRHFVHIEFIDRLHAEILEGDYPGGTDGT